jgi:hypothetical protein
VRREDGDLVSDGVRMTHPTLEGQEITVPDSAVPFHRSAGWVIEPDQENQGEQWPKELQRFEGQDQVRLRHPDLDEEITVAGSAVATHQKSGWVPVEVEAAEGKFSEQVAPGAFTKATDELDDLTVEDLKERIRALNEQLPEDQRLPVSGTKPELLERLRTAPPPEQAEADAAQANQEAPETDEA